MTEFSHARCGGVLVEIPAPDWAPRRAFAEGTVPPPPYARCSRCNRPGELARGPETNNPPQMDEGLLQASP